MITIGEVIELGMPPGHRLVAGEKGLNAEVTWATRPAPNPPAFGHLQGGELIFLTPNTLENLDERITLDAAIRQLSAFGVSGIAFTGRIPAAARETAERIDLPLLQLSADSDLAQIERETSHLINERRRESQRRTLDTSRRLMELAISGEPIEEMARVLSDVSGAAVIVKGRDAGQIAIAMEGTSSSAVVEMVDRLDEQVETWLRSVPVGSPAEPPVTTLPTENGDCLVVSPIIGRDGLLGILELVVSSKAALNEMSAIASRGAAACSVVLSREQAAAQARQELELNVLDEVLDGALRSEESLIQQARRLGHDLIAPHVAFILRQDAAVGGSGVRALDDRQSLYHDVLDPIKAPLLWRVRNNQLEIVAAVADSVSATALSRRIHRDLEARLQRSGKGPMSMGAGRVQRGILGIRQSHQEARQALQMGRRLEGPGSLTQFDDLGVFRLIFAAQSLPELRTFHDEALGTLLEYDRRHGGELVETLQAYFASKCSPKEAAVKLGVHRNTILYRLARIEELAGISLDDADVRLRLHLATTAHIALFGEKSGSARRTAGVDASN